MGSDAVAAAPAPAAAAEDLALIREASLAAADIALDHFRRGARQWTKDDASPVTEADLAVDRYLLETLTAARPEYGWLSEETADEPTRLSRRRVFVVDPIDGTKAFIAGEDRWMVSVAVVEDGRPLVGCLVRPATGAVFTAARGGGAFRDGERLSIRPRPDPAGARVSGPRRLTREPEAVAAGMEAVRYIPSLALRLAMVAAGELDGVLTHGGSSDWDLAAADLVVTEAGGIVESYEGRPLAFNGRRPDQPVVIACRPGLDEPLRTIAERLGHARRRS